MVTEINVETSLTVLRTINNSCVMPLGTANISLILNNTVFTIEALVVEDLPAGLLLGFNFLKENVDKIYFCLNRLILKDKSHMLVPVEVNTFQEWKPQLNSDDRYEDHNFVSVMHSSQDLSNFPWQYMSVMLKYCMWLVSSYSDK